MVRKIPTAVAAFDSIIKGGVPEGSLIMLLGEPGAGGLEFAITSASKLSIARKNPERRPIIIGGYNDDTYIPSGTSYISLTRNEWEVKRLVSLTVNTDLYTSFFDNFRMRDLSPLYFKNSSVPRSWVSSGSIFGQVEGKDILEEIVKFLNENGNDRVVIIDSLTDLITSPQVDQNVLIDVIKGLEKVSKKWSSIIYLILTEGIADRRMEQILYDIVDGILVFKWYSSEKYTIRFRYLYVPKFIGVLAHIEEERVLRFQTKVDYNEGFIVTYTERIR
ncbi:MAG TPA: recombinase RecA [Euryarchaeota archaeon]|nr:MAG: recombinase RecA [Aciduliprofundum sp.]HEU12730.1 recombinase RecA [Euryarchaeota archaeon]